MRGFRLTSKDRKLIYAGITVLAAIALELGWYLFARLSAEAWTAIFTGVLTASTIGLWFSTRQSARVAERALVDLERPYIFVYELSLLKRDKFGMPYITYSVGNYGKTAAIIERVRALMWNGDPFVMPEVEYDPAEMADNPILITRVFSPDYAKDAVEYYIGDEIHIAGSNSEAQYPAAESEENLFFRIIVDYRGPFTEGHISSYCWEYDCGPGVFVLKLDNRLTYSR